MSEKFRLAIMLTDLCPECGDPIDREADDWGQAHFEASGHYPYDIVEDDPASFELPTDFEWQ